MTHNRPASTEYEAAVCAHAAYYCARVKHEGPRLAGSGLADEGQAQMDAMQVWAAEIENIEAALKRAISRRDRAWLSPLAEYLAAYLNRVSNFVLMQECYSALLECAAHLADPRLQAQAQAGLGRAIWRLGDSAQALSLLNTARAGFLAASDSRSEAYVICAQAAVQRALGKYEVAAGLDREALEMFSKLDCREGKAQVLSHLGVIHYDQGEYAQSAEVLGQALELYRGLGDRRGEAGTLGSLASLEYDKGNYALSAELNRQVLEICREAEYGHVEAVTLANLSLFYHGQGDDTEASILAGRSLAILREIGDRRGEAYCLVNQAIFQSALQDYASAESLLEEALLLFRELGDRSGEAMACGDLAGVCYSRGELTRAARLQSEGLEICVAIGDRPGIAIACASASAILAAGGQLRDASLVLAAAENCAAAMGYQFEAAEHRMPPEAEARLKAAVSAAEISAEQRAAWRAEGEDLTLEALARFTLASLQKLPEGA